MALLLALPLAAALDAHSLRKVRLTSFKTTFEWQAVATPTWEACVELLAVNLVGLTHASRAALCHRPDVWEPLFNPFMSMIIYHVW